MQIGSTWKESTVVSDVDVVNVVGTITYEQGLELSALAEDLAKREEVSSTVYEPAENHWLQVRLKSDDTYIAVYRSGKCSIVGCDSIEEFSDTAEEVTGVIGDLLEVD